MKSQNTTVKTQQTEKQREKADIGLKKGGNPRKQFQRGGGRFVIRGKFKPYEEIFRRGFNENASLHLAKTMNSSLSGITSIKKIMKLQKKQLKLNKPKSKREKAD